MFRNLKITKKGFLVLGSCVLVVGYGIYEKNKDNVGVSTITKVDSDSGSGISVTISKDVSDIFDVNLYPFATMNDKYGKIRIVEELSGMSVIKLNEMLKTYSTYTKLSYEECIKVIKDNYQKIRDDYDSFKEGIVCTLFDEAVNKGNLSIQDNNPLQVYETFPDSIYDRDEMDKKLEQRKKQEDIMIKICDDLNMDDTDKIVVFSIFRLETGHGASERCVYDNNYGGNRVPYSLEYCKFTTPEFGMYYDISHIKYYYLDKLKKDGYNTPEVIIQKMSSIYSEMPNEWCSRVLEQVENVKKDHSLGDIKSKTV